MRGEEFSVIKKVSLKCDIITVPIMSPMGKVGLGNFRTLANFRSEVSRYKPQKGTMVNTPAIIAGEFGKGRVLCISPHPESTIALYSLVQNAIRWTARHD